ncbi:hypothetical protein D3C87_1666630 [compost metagenome]
MKFNGLVNISINKTVAVRQQERLVVGIRQYTLQSSGSHCFQPGINHRNLKWLCIIIQKFNTVVLHIYRHIGIMQEVIGKILFDMPAFITQANDKFGMPVMRIGFHDMP